MACCDQGEAEAGHMIAIATSTIATIASVFGAISPDSRLILRVLQLSCHNAVLFWFRVQLSDASGRMSPLTKLEY